MWSKQADTRAKQATTGFKNKISHRKRKGEKSKGNQQTPAATEVKKGKEKEKIKVTEKSEKKEPDLIEDLKQNAKNKNGLIDETDNGVVLRKKPNNNNETADKQKSNDVKRYSDSYVIDNNLICHPDTSTTLSRAHSGFFFTTSSEPSENKEKRSRRFSDLFRHSTANKTNCDSAKTHPKMTTEFDISDSGVVISIQSPSEPTFLKPEAKNKTKDKKSVKRTDSSKKVRDIPKTQPQTKLKEESPSNSVLKRVRSKIYKHKNENGVSAVPTMPGICENRENDCCLIRQTSNLEFIRPKTTNFTHKKTQSVDANGGGFGIFEKPVLAKSKSSGAINLSMLRSRRSKLPEGMKSCKEAHDEFDFIAFGGIKSCTQFPKKFGSQDLSNHLNNNVPSVRRSSWIGITLGETRPGNPVTRTPSDRRPDAVREESSRTQDAHVQSHENDNDAANPESSVSLPASTGGNKRRQHTHINRSESVKEQSEKNRKQRRNVSDPLHTTSETVDLDHPFNPNSGSSSNSSLSSRSLDSPSSNAEQVSDSDLDVEADAPDWKSSLTDEQLSRLHPDEKKRQDVINELFHTERSHVRNLKVLDQVFRRNIAENRVLTESELKLVFANLTELLLMHNQFNQAMKSKRKENPIVPEIGDILLNMFDGETGTNFCAAASKFCENQQLAMQLIKQKRNRDPKFESVLFACEKNNLCRRLPLQGFIPQEMQRLSKYPLLLERLIESEEKIDRVGAGAEIEKLTRALEKSREFLITANEAAKQAYNKARLEDISEHLDKQLFERSAERALEQTLFSEFKNFELTNCTLIHEGTVTLKRPNKNPLSVHMLLLQEAVILFQKEGERFILKFFQLTGHAPLAPIIKISNVICRENAADYVTLFLVSNTQSISQMYEIQCRDATERKTWFKYLTDATEPYKIRDGKGKRAERNHDPEEETVQELPPSRTETSERAESVSQDVDSPSVTSVDSSHRTDQEDEREDKRPKQDTGGAVPAVNSAGEGVSIKLTANDWPLIQPSDVQVAFPPVHTAEPVLTPLEQIRRKDEEVKQALAAKEVLVADLLSIPREDYHHIADIASDEATKKSPCDREPSELVLASVYQVDQLLAAVNNSLNISETDPVLSTGGKHSACASNDLSTAKPNNVPSIPISRLQDIATTLNSQLTILLSVVKHREEEREKMRKEMHRMREQLHELNSLHGPTSAFDDKSTQYDSLQSGDLESIEESPTETETT